MATLEEKERNLQEAEKAVMQKICYQSIAV